MGYKDKEKQRVFQRLYSRKRTIEYKLKAVMILGGCCVRCSIEDIRVLQFDHIVPELRPKGSYSAVRTAKYVATGKLDKKEIQLLCANCHSIKTYEEDRKHFKNYIKDVEVV